MQAYLRRVRERETSLAQPVDLKRLGASATWRTALASVLGALTLGCTVMRAPSVGQQPDKSFQADSFDPAFPGGGPTVGIDAAHANFHTLKGRYWAFGELVRRDGFCVRAFETAFTPNALAGIDVLVIANAGELPPVEGACGAFRLHEIDALHEWVLRGGALLLVTDHDPAGLPSAALASRFGVAMSHGFAVDDEHCVDGEDRSWIEFSRDNGQVKDHAITNGRSSSDRVERIVAYTGQAMAVPPGGEVFLALAPTATNVGTRAEVYAQAPPEPVQLGVWNAMGVALKVGKGRVVMVSEAAMLTAQVVHNAEGEITERFGGFNDPSVDAQKLVRNIVRWLVGALD